MGKILDLVSNMIHMPLWTWGVIGIVLSIVLVFIIKSDPVEIGSKLFGKLFGKSFSAIGNHLGNFFHTKYGKWITIGAVIGFIGLGAWKFFAPTVEQNSQNQLISQAYNNIPETEKYMAMGNPYIHDRPNERIEAWRKNDGNVNCMYIHVSNQKEKKRGLLGIRTMEFRVCQNLENNWVYERTAKTHGAFTSDADFSASMVKVVDIISQHPFVPFKEPAQKEKVGLLKRLKRKLSFEEKEVNSKEK